MTRGDPRAASADSPCQPYHLPDRLSRLAGEEGTFAPLGLCKVGTFEDSWPVLSSAATMVAVGDVVLALVKAIVLSWGALTNWAYRLIYSSAKKVKNFNKVTGVYITL